MNEPDQRVLEALNFLLHKRKEKVQSSAKLNKSELALPSLIDVLKQNKRIGQ